jgi:RNA polymerase sigma-70 factor (ECF subfamily)
MTSTPDTLESVIAAAKAGSKEALAHLLERYRPYLEREARQQLDRDLQRKVADSDLVQDTLMAALKWFPEFKGFSEEQLLAWLVAILTRRAQKVHRQFRGTAKRDIGRERPLTKSIAEGVPAQEWEGTEATTSQLDEDGECMRLTFKLLPAEYQQIVRLRREVGMTFEEVGVIMGRTAEAAKKLWTRMLRRWGNDAELLKQNRAKLRLEKVVS